MKTINFSANSTTGTLNGTLLMRADSSEILFDSLLPEFIDEKIKEKDIKDVNNFIASFIRRLDKNEHFDDVLVEGNLIPVKREGVKPSKTTMDVFVIGELHKQVIIQDQTITVKDLNNNKIKMKTSELIDNSRKVTVPTDFQYVRDEKLNSILKYNVIPFDYNRTLNQTAFKILKELKKRVDSIPSQKIAYIDRYDRLTFSINKHNKLVIPRSFWA
jgi:hypothetical protein